MTVFLYGQAPSRTSDPDHPFSGRSGRFLAELAGISQERLGEFFVLRNLLTAWPGSGRAKGDAFPIARARERAKEEISSWEAGDVVLLAGRGVASAFGLGRLPWLERVRLANADVIVIPHPSGVNAVYNNPRRRAEVHRLLRGLIIDVERERNYAPA